MNVDDLVNRREAVAARLAVALERGNEDPIRHRLDEYRACIAELDAWIAEEHNADRAVGATP